MRFVNPVMSALLRSPLHGLLSRQVFLLTVTGRRSGRRFTLPLGYVRDGDALLVVAQHSDQKRWWRNLRGGAPVALHLRGRRAIGRAEVIETPLAVAAEIERLIARLGPKEASARLYMGLDTTSPPTPEQLARALDGVVLVRVVLDRPDGSGRPAAAAPVEAGRDTIRKVLLGCGVLSSVQYVAAEVYAWTRYPGYSPVAQGFSELLAEGAPTRAFLVAVAGAPYNLLVAALGAGVWLAAGGKRIPRITGALLVLYALISYLGGTVFQMDPREVEGSVRTMLHERATAVMVLSMLLAMGVGAFLHGRRFRLYSLGTLLTVVVFAGLTFQQVARLAAHEPAPWLGVIERVNIYAWMLWVAVLAISLWPARGGPRPRPPWAGARAPAGGPGSGRVWRPADWWRDAGRGGQAAAGRRRNSRPTS
jgi:hypothetical protein